MKHTKTKKPPRGPLMEAWLGCEDCVPGGRLCWTDLKEDEEKEGLERAWKELEASGDKVRIAITSPVTFARLCKQMNVDAIRFGDMDGNVVLQQDPNAMPGRIFMWTVNSNGR